MFFLQNHLSKKNSGSRFVNKITDILRIAHSRIRLFNPRAIHYICFSPHFAISKNRKKRFPFFEGNESSQTVVLIGPSQKEEQSGDSVLIPANTASLPLQSF